MGVDIAWMLFAVGPDGGGAALPELVVYLWDPAASWLAPLALVWLEGRRGGLSGGGTISCFLRLCFADPAIDFHSRCAPHLVCHMGVDVQRGGG